MNSGKTPILHLLASIVVALGLMLASASLVSAHAELVSASPPADGTVTSLPSSMTLVFSEEVKPGGVTVQVTGPDGARVDTGDAAVDLTDAERSSVKVSLFAGGPGEYSVHWETISNIDGDSAQGDYTFNIAPQAAIGSPAALGTPLVVTTNVSAEATPTLDPDSFGNPLREKGDFDSRAFALSIGAGVLALAVIVGIWYLVRPKNPKFGPRAKQDED